MSPRDKLAIVLSHHNSLTLENTAEPRSTPGGPLIHADEFIAMLVKYPNMIAWLNGHTHTNTIKAHPNADNTGGFWEITTASCIDYPQQQGGRHLRQPDGTMSIFAIVLDHASPAQWINGDFSQVGIASLSRERVASNDWTATPFALMGSDLDRNVELILPAPFDLERSATRTSTRRSSNAQRQWSPKNTKGQGHETFDPCRRPPAAGGMQSDRPVAAGRHAEVTAVRIATNDVLVDKNVPIGWRRCATRRGAVHLQGHHSHGTGDQVEAKSPRPLARRPPSTGPTRQQSLPKGDCRRQEIFNGRSRPCWPRTRRRRNEHRRGLTGSGGVPLLGLVQGSWR